MAKTIREINEKIKKGNVVVVTAEEMIDIVKEDGPKKAAEKIDVVTTGTFSPMCSSGMYINFGHSKPRIKFGGGKTYLNKVPAYTGLAAVDIYLGASALPDNDPRNAIYPGTFKYGGGHVIEEFVRGEDILLEAEAYGTDCYPRKKLKVLVNIKDANEAVLFNLRNCLQNYEVAVNLSEKTIYTYMGILKPRLGNAGYTTSGQLSPLLNDPYYETIGIGTRVFVGGGIGYIAWHGTQHNPNVKRRENGIPVECGGALAIIGDLKQMSHEWLIGTTLVGYGVSLTVGIGIPIPVLNERIAKFTGVSDSEIYSPIVDYSKVYPQLQEDILGEVSHAELKSGEININGKKVPTFSHSSYAKAREIAKILKNWLKEGKYLFTQPVAPLPGPGSNVFFKNMKMREPEGERNFL